MLGYAGNMNRNHDVGKLSVAEACGIVLACLAVVILAASCRKTDETSISDEGKAKPPCAETRVEVKNVQIEAEMSQDARYKAEFERLVVSSNMTVSATWSQASALCEEISKLPEAEAIPLLDKLLEMAIDQHVAETNLYHRQVWLRQLFYVAGAAFCFAQGKRKDSFGDWDRMFRFFGKCTNEIAAVEQSLSSSNRRYWDASDLWKASYLSKIKDDFETWIHIIRDFHFPSLSEGLTEEQKADILHRFDELKKYTVTPPNFPGGKKLPSASPEPNVPGKVSCNGAVSVERKQ